MIDDPNRFPAEFGEKIVVLGSVTEQFRPIVSYMEWLSNEARWKIELLWQNGDISNVYSSDKGKYWITEKEYKLRLLN